MSNIAPRRGENRVTADDSTDDNAYLSTKQAAKHLNISSKTLESMRYRGDGPVFTRVTARLVRYEKSAIDAYLAERRFHNTSEARVGRGGHGG